MTLHGIRMFSIIRLLRLRLLIIIILLLLLLLLFFECLAPLGTCREPTCSKCLPCIIIPLNISLRHLNTPPSLFHLFWPKMKALICSELVWNDLGL